MRLSSISSLRSYPITVFFLIVFGLLLSAILASLLIVARFGIETEKKQKQEAIEHQVKRLSAVFNSSEGQQILSNLMIGNLNLFNEAKRPFTPIYLPKRNWVDLPLTPNLKIEDTPRFCKVKLKSLDDESEHNEDNDVTACAYVTDGIRVKGTYLYLNLSFLENELVPHKPGFPFYADYLILSIMWQDKAKSWRIVFRETKNKKIKNLYDIVAFHVDQEDNKKVVSQSANRREFSGWAERTNGTDSHKIITNIFLRISYQEINPTINQLSIDELEKKWPPNDLDSIKIELVRNDVDKFGGQDKLIFFEKEVEAMLSLPSLYKEHELGGSILTLARFYQSENKTEKILAYPENNILPYDKISKITNSNPWWHKIIEPMFDILIQKPEKIFNEIKIQDLPFRLRLERYTEIGTELRKRVIFFVLCIFFAVVMVGLALWLLVFRRINRLSENANRLATDPLGSDEKLANQHRRTEIGTLTKAFNSVLHKAREQASELKIEQIRRENDLRQRYDEEIKRREELLNTVGHDIRSPLQQLLALHPQGSDSRRPVERIIRAVKRLYGETAPEDAYAIEPLNLSEIDIADFLKIFVSNKKKTFPNLEYIGLKNGVIVKSEDIALEEVVDQIVCNAESFHIPGTQVTVELLCSAGDAVISITNLGPSIPSDALEKIFHLGVSIREKSSESEHRGQGLYMALGYVRKMGGSIIAKNILGGVVFEIYLPLVI